jgi:putative redox protein
MAINVRPKETLATFSVSSIGTGVAQTVRPGGSTHVIPVDAAPAFGGRDSAPSPISYALAALVSCSQVTAQIVAKDLGIKLESFAFELAADLDTAVLVGGSRDADANFERVSVDATIRTNATPEQFAALKLETERRCPIYQLFARSGVELVTNWRAEA